MVVEKEIEENQAEVTKVLVETNEIKNSEVAIDFDAV